MSELPLVTVVMPVRNEARSIERSLGAVIAQDYPRERLEVLVVDGLSEDGTAALVRRLAEGHPFVRLLENPGRTQAAGLNRAIRQARGEIVVRVDGRTLIAPDYVRRCVELLRSGRAEDVGGRMVPEGEGWVGRGIARALASPFAAGDSKFHYAEGEHYVDTVYLGAYRRETLERIGLYDEEADVNEDYELNLRLRRAGGRILLSPRLRSTYLARPTLGALARQYFRYGRWKARTLRRHPGSLVWRQTVAPALVAALVASLALGLVWRPALVAFAAVAAIYLLAAAGAALIASRGAFSLAPVVLAAFLVIHLSWGLGLWSGLVAPPASQVGAR